MNTLPHNAFKEALAAGSRQIGLWINFAHHVIAEVVAHSGFDWLLFDMEHTPNDLQIVGQQLLAVRGTPDRGHRARSGPRHGVDQARARRRRAERHGPEHPQRRRGARSGVVDAVPPGGAARRGGQHARRQLHPLQGLHGPCERRDRPDTADRVARGARRSRRHLSRPGRGRRLHRPFGPGGESRAPRAAGAPGRAGGDQQGIQDRSQRGAGRAASSPPTARPSRISTRVRRWSASEPTCTCSSPRPTAWQRASSRRRDRPGATRPRSLARAAGRAFHPTLTVARYKEPSFPDATRGCGYGRKRPCI